MALVTFTFTYDTEKKEAVISGNIPLRSALRILQDIAFSKLEDQKAEAPKENKE